jgi:hypothetical protein
MVGGGVDEAEVLAAADDRDLDSSAGLAGKLGLDALARSAPRGVGLHGLAMGDDQLENGVAHGDSFEASTTASRVISSTSSWMIKMKCLP